VGGVLATLAATVVVVAVGGTVTVTVAVPEEAARVVAPLYVAVMMLAPAVRLDPFTVSEAVPLARTADPSDVVPVVKAMLPVGAVLPVAGFTVTVKSVDAAAAMVAGFAVTAVVVAGSGAVTVSVIGDAAEAEKPVAPT
jgi:hypothetical protein